MKIIEEPNCKLKLEPELIDFLDNLKREYKKSCNIMKPCVECKHFLQCGAVLKNSTGIKTYDDYRFYYSYLMNVIHDLNMYMNAQEYLLCKKTN